MRSLSHILWQVKAPLRRALFAKFRLSPFGQPMLFSAYDIWMMTDDDSGGTDTLFEKSVFRESFLWSTSIYYYQIGLFRCQIRAPSLPTNRLYDQNCPKLARLKLKRGWKVRNHPSIQRISQFRQCSQSFSFPTGFLLWNFSLILPYEFPFKMVLG